MAYDPWVANVQYWLNSTYTGVAGWNPVIVDGVTGWATMRALTRALQYELGITALADNFGPATMTALTNFGNITPNTNNSNILNILIGGLYCKGYNAGNGQLPGVWMSLTTSAVESIQRNIGIPATGIVIPKLFKAILNMDAYVLVGNGQGFVREVQQWMNATYLNRSWFSIIPADGSYSRDVQTALVYAIQEELGVAGANGSYGPGTRAAVQAKTPIVTGMQDSAGRHWVRLFQAAMRFNLYNVTFNGTFSAPDAAHVAQFQAFAKLAVTSQGDYQTWSSLLVSNGDPTRVGTAADAVSQVTAERAATLVANGRTAIGRYLTNATGSSLNKKIQNGELEVIFNAGLHVFPIFQTFGSTAQYFNNSQGASDASDAVNAAKEYGFGPSTIIYFAVDFDATDATISANIIPHFEGIRAGMVSAGNRYRVGVYGTRNVCNSLSRRGLAESSFVAGMSYGYSGNLGFRLPDNWAFDQISTVTLGSGIGAIEIDNNIASGRDLGAASVSTQTDELDAFLEWLRFVEARAAEWLDTTDVMEINRLTAQYIASFKDNTYIDYWHGSDVVFGSFDQQFREHVRNYVGLPPVGSLICPKTDVENDLQHFGASLMGAYEHDFHNDRTSVSVADFAGWAGDAITLSANAYNEDIADNDAFAWAYAQVGSDEGQMSGEDVLADLDAIYVAMNTELLQAPISDVLEQGYRSVIGAQNRYDSVMSLRWDSSIDVMRAAFRAVMSQNFDLVFDALRGGLWLNRTNVPILIATALRPGLFMPLLTGAADAIYDKFIA